MDNYSKDKPFSIHHTSQFQFTARDVIRVLMGKPCQVDFHLEVDREVEVVKGTASAFMHPVFKPRRNRGGAYQAVAAAILFCLVFISCTTKPVPTQCPCPCPPGPDTTQVNATNLDHYQGTCTFTWTPATKIGALGSGRAYIAADFISTAQGLFVQPIFKSRTDPDGGLDTWIEAMNKAGATAILCVNQTPSWMLSQGQAQAPKSKAQAEQGSFGYDPHGDFKRHQSGELRRLRMAEASAASEPDHPPIKPGLSRTDPKSYAEYAKIFGELAKRYGKKKHDPATQWVNTTPRWTNDPPNQKLSGLNYDVVLEVWNEPDKWWRQNDGSGIYFLPEEYAALFSACAAAAKAADPDTKVWSAGLTGFDAGYMERFLAALKQLGGPMPDGFTVHHYSHHGNKLGQWPPTWWDSGACSPERDQDFNGVDRFVALAKQYKVGLHVTEYGTDTRPPSWMYPMAVPGKNAEQTQGDWAVRTALEYLRKGVAGVNIFNGNDEVNARQGGLYQNSGLLYGEGEPGKVFAPKPSYAQVKGLHDFLKGKQYVADESVPGLRALKFTDGAGAAWGVYWLPTQEGKTETVTLWGGSKAASETPSFVRL